MNGTGGGKNDLRVVFSWLALCITPSMVIQLGGIGWNMFVRVALAYSYSCHRLGPICSSVIRLLACYWLT